MAETVWSPVQKEQVLAFLLQHARDLLEGIAAAGDIADARDFGEHLLHGFFELWLVQLLQPGLLAFLRRVDLAGARACFDERGGGLLQLRLGGRLLKGLLVERAILGDCERHAEQQQRRAEDACGHGELRNEIEPALRDASLGHPSRAGPVCQSQGGYALLQERFEWAFRVLDPVAQVLHLLFGVAGQLQIFGNRQLYAQLLFRFEQTGKSLVQA
jgi:hypothetical protein